MGTVANGQFLQRSGSTIIGVAAPTGLALTAVAPVNVTRVAAAVGVSTEAARGDHKHDISVAAPVTIGTANATGTSSSLAAANHVHAHGNQAGGALHAVAVAGVSNGFLSAADKTKLDGIGVFGSEYHRAQDLPIDTNSTTTFNTKVTLGPVSLDGGVYRVEWGYGWNLDSQSNDFEARLLQDAVQLGELHKQEPQDSRGSDPTGTTQRFYAHRQRFETLSAGNHTWVVEWRTASGGTAASIWEATIEVVRVG
jgi:hypothetical protein